MPFFYIQNQYSSFFAMFGSTQKMCSTYIPKPVLNHLNFGFSVLPVDNSTKLNIDVFTINISSICEEIKGNKQTDKAARQMGMFRARQQHAQATV